jgi:septal ring factor EnvC (AmiA/AmiB activator)
LKKSQLSHQTHTLNKSQHSQQAHKFNKFQLSHQVGENFIRQLRDTEAFIQEVQDKHNTKLDDELKSMKEKMQAMERYFTGLQHMIDSVKTRINAPDDNLARLKIQMGLMESLMKAEGERCALIQEDGGGEKGFGAYGTDGRRSSIHEALMSRRGRLGNHTL